MCTRHPATGSRKRIGYALASCSLCSRGDRTCNANPTQKMMGTGEEVSGALDVKREGATQSPLFPESILNIEAVRCVTALVALLRVGPQLWAWRMLPQHLLWMFSGAIQPRKSGFLAYRLPAGPLATRPWLRAGWLSLIYPPAGGPGPAEISGV